MAEVVQLRNTASPEKRVGNAPAPSLARASVSSDRQVMQEAARELQTRPTPYTVKKGDTYSSIAKAHGISLQDLKRLNPKANPDRIEVGDAVNLPLPKRYEISPAQRQQTDSYYVAKGDTFSSIAKKFDTIPLTIFNLNPGVSPTKLQVGDRLLVPHVERQSDKSTEQKSGPSEVTITKSEVKAALAVLDASKKEIEQQGRGWVMREGSASNPDAVKALHLLLNAAGARPPLEGTVFTGHTREALEGFQRAYGLGKDGKMGAQALEGLKIALLGGDDLTTMLRFTEARSEKLDDIRKGKLLLRMDPASASPTWPSEGPPPDFERLAQVRQLKTLLNDAGAWPPLEENGLFDEATKRAVKQFQKSQGFAAKDCDGVVGPVTIARLDKSHALFVHNLTRLVGEEGGLANNPHDRGGLTNRGVTQGVYDEWRDRHGLAARPVSAMDLLEMRAIYRQVYWNQLHCEKYPPGIVTTMFDTAVLFGPGRARSFLRQAAESTNISLNDIESLNETQQRQLGMAMVKLRTDRHAQRIASDESQKVFGDGWDNRAKRLALYFRDNSSLK